MVQILVSIINYPERFVSYSITEDTVGNYLNPASWRCSMVWSAYMGLPLSLESVGAVLGLEQQKIERRQRTHPLFLCSLCSN